MRMKQAMRRIDMFVSSLPSIRRRGILSRAGGISNRTPSSFRIVEIDEKKQNDDQERWKGLVRDMSDDQQDITRGKGMVEPLFQAPMDTDFFGALRARVYDDEVRKWTESTGIEQVGEKLLKDLQLSRNQR
ncbi:hypothetical protein HAX54_051969 [Datura stramonium]|uniref:Ribulose bisphosphate carboxylase/oxygenase activase AAA helical domain-containing protein n=1 Tax=Datura stramonium TaxID=4076 RepID=A0ABS8SZB4_DATST|nr:hypothetical protein [Datura stramonium]